VAHQLLEGEIIQGGDDDPDLNASFYDFIDQVKSEANSGGSIAVFEVPRDANGNARPNTLNKPKLFTVPVGSCTFDDICDRVLKEFVEPGQSILIQLLGRKDGKRGHLLNQLIPLRRGKATSASDGTTSGDIERLMRVMNEQRQRDLADMRSMIENVRPPQIDPLAQSLAITEKLTAMAVAMSGRSGAVGVAGVPNNPQGMMEQMMALMMTTMMKKFMSGMDGEKEKSADNSWLKDIAELAKPLLEAKAVSEKTALVREQRMLRHEASAPAPAPTESNAATPKTPGPSTTEENDMKLIAMLTEFLPMLIDNFALKGAEAGDVSKLTLDNLPEEDVGLNDALYQLIQSEPAEFLAKLATMDARVKDHAEWFEEYRQALLAAFDPDERVPQTGKPT
jgi:hypothetical protein